MALYLALLRGINVGGNNIFKMTDLAAEFQALGFQNVQTYIQSGNVIFAADDTDHDRLNTRIEQALSKSFNYDSNVVLRSHDDLRAVVERKPEGFGSQPDTYRYDVLFLKKPLTSVEVMQELNPKEGVDQAYNGDGVLYFARLTSRASQSRLTRIIGTPVYQRMTIRNWNTTTRLLNIMEGIL